MDMIINFCCEPPDLPGIVMDGEAIGQYIWPDSMTKYGPAHAQCRRSYILPFRVAVK